MTKFLSCYSYAVLAYLVGDDKVGASLESLPWTWSYLTCMNRVAERVAKVRFTLSVFIHSTINMNLMVPGT